MRLTLLAVAVLSVACSSSSGWDLDRPADTFDPPPSSPQSSDKTGSESEQASLAIGSSGGRVTTSNGSGVSIPSGALSSDVTITIKQVTHAPTPGDAIPVGPTFLLGPEGQKFEHPVTVTLEFDPSELYDGESASDLVVYTSPKENPSFTPLATSVVDTTHVSAETTHFSYVVATHGNVKKSYTISYAPNSYVVGNVYAGWTDDVRGHEVFGKGPGNSKGVNYQCGFIFGTNFDHCGWIDHTVVSGSGSSEACGNDCPATYDTSLFKPTYTDGTINPDDSDGSPTHMHYSGSGCSDKNGYGNVSPWRVPAKPANSVGEVPDGKLLLWRYVTKDGHWVLVRDPEPPSGQPNWYFVHRGCVSLAPPPPPCGVLQQGDSLKFGSSDNQVWSCNHDYLLNLAENGSIVEVHEEYGNVWQHSGETGDHLDMQSDGNLVLYDTAGKALWATMTNGHAGAYLSLGDDGSLVVKDGSTTLWTRP